jgi:phosphoenolpyruvate carboxykinase (GTP)
VLKWVFERCAGTADAIETPIGNLPAPGALDMDGLDVPSAAMHELLHVDVEGWRAMVPLIEQHYAQFGERLPGELADQLTELDKRLAAAG